MKKYLFPENGKFYKANLHCHTTLSDGNLTPTEIKALYRAQGYSVVAYTDHEALLDHSDLCDETFIALNGYETAIKEVNGISTGKAPTMAVHHINFIKKRPNDLGQFCFFPANFTPGNCKEQIPFIQVVGDTCEYAYTPEFFRYLTSEAHKNGCLVHYNHPAWSLQSAADIALLDGIDGLEVFNTGCRYHGDFNDGVYRDLLRAGKNMYVVAGDDNHNNENGLEDSFGAWTMICAESFRYEAITDALEKGNAYVTSGPTIYSLYAEDGQLIVHTSPASHILLHSEGRVVRCAHGKDGYVDAAAFALIPDKLGSFFRLEIIDKNGNRAYTRAYSTNDFA